MQSLSTGEKMKIPICSYGLWGYCEVKLLHLPLSLRKSGHFVIRRITNVSRALSH